MMALAPLAKEGSLKDKLLYYEQLWAILGDLHIGVFTVNSQRKITSFNRAAEFLTGHKEEDVVGKYCHQVFQNDLCRGECRFHQAVEAEQSSLSFDVEIRDKNNENHTITKIVTPLYNLERELIGCIEVFQDRSAFEDLINRIRYGERQLKIILDNLDIGVFTVTRGGLINFFNTLAEAISGYRREELLGKPCSIIFPEEKGGCPALLQKSIEDGKSRANKKEVITSKEGATIPIRASYLALRNEKGRIVGGLATIQDLSVIDQFNRAISSRYIFADMIGRDPSVQKIFEIVPVVSGSDATVLIEGATGTGKDLLAKVIHNSGSRAEKPFVKVNCAALPDNLLESEMFGYVKGAFTGAAQDKPGRFQEASGGSIFLDEIGDLPFSLQAKLLRVLEDKEFYPLGSRKTTRVDVRIIAATNQGLERLVEEKRFREDLFYRLNVIRLELPPLKNRRGDIPLLVDHVMKRLITLRSTGVKRLSEETLAILLNYDYPGNVRELENILEHALIICQDEVIEPRHLPLFLQKGGGSAHRPMTLSDEPEPLLQEEKRRITEALQRHDGRRGQAAKDLRMDRTTLWRKMKRHRIIP